MALCRCLDKKHTSPKGSTEEYVIWKEPIGYPKGSSICGRKDCDNDGVIWLTKKELSDYNKGKRVFSYASAVSKVKVK